MECVLNNKMEYLSESDMINYKSYIISDYYTDSKILNIFDIVGVQYQDYPYTWIDMLKKGQRMKSSNFPSLTQNPKYYFELSQKKPLMHFVKVNNKIFVGDDGMHRTVIAKVLFYFLRLQNFGKVLYNEYVIDFEFMEIHRKLEFIIKQKNLPLSLDVKNKIIKRNDGPGWKKDFYKINIEIFNLNTINRKRLILNKKETAEFIKELEQLNFIRKIFKTGKYLRQIL